MIKKICDVLSSNWWWCVPGAVLLIGVADGVVELKMATRPSTPPPGWVVVTDGHGYYAPKRVSDGWVFRMRARRSIAEAIDESKECDETYGSVDINSEPPDAWREVKGTNQ